MPRRILQPELSFHPRGGRRPGAGRKKGNRVSHASRPRFAAPTPAHITVRVRSGTWNLRSQRSYRLIAASLAAARGRHGLRVLEYSVLGNHLHVVAEADDDRALSRGMQGLLVRLAKALNAMMQRRGRVFDDHFHARLLRTPTELVRALRYVLGNHEHHYGTKGIDRFSSAALDTGDRRTLLGRAVGWLASVGWRRAKERGRIPGWSEPAIARATAVARSEGSRVGVRPQG